MTKHYLLQLLVPNPVPRNPQLVLSTMPLKKPPRRAPINPTPSPLRPSNLKHPPTVRKCKPIARGPKPLTRQFPQVNRPPPPILPQPLRKHPTAYRHDATAPPVKPDPIKHPLNRGITPPRTKTNGNNTRRALRTGNFYRKFPRP